MKIISKFKDYYDGAVQYGYDPDLTFVRETSEASNQVPDIVRQLLNKMGQRYDFSCIFFCGKAYPVYRYSDDKYINHYGNADDIIKDAENRKNSRKLNYYPIEGFFKDEVFAYDWREKQKFAYTEKGLKAAEEYFKEIKIPNEVFVQLDCPYFVAHYAGGDITIVKNPQLSKYVLFKYLDAFTCYQEIRMFLGNVLTVIDQMPITTGDDKVIAQQKGFDEMSFRTAAPGKKKENRKQNKMRKKGLA